MRLSDPDYLIHGTNKPSGVGLRVSHGCMRLYPENIASLFESAPHGTTVQIVNQPVLVGWRGEVLYLEVHPPLAEDTRDLLSLATEKITAALKRKSVNPLLDQDLIAEIVIQKIGIPIPVNQQDLHLPNYLASARKTLNLVPEKNAEVAAAGR
ncbi:MAG: L,D-transpeptidase family protein [Pseudomonadota bacterium]